MYDFLAIDLDLDIDWVRPEREDVNLLVPRGLTARLCCRHHHCGTGPQQWNVALRIIQLVAACHQEVKGFAGVVQFP